MTRVMRLGYTAKGKPKKIAMSNSQPTRITRDKIKKKIVKKKIKLKRTRTRFDREKRWNQTMRNEIKNQFQLKKYMKKIKIKITRAKFNIKIKCQMMILKNKVNTIKNSKPNILEWKKRESNLIQWTNGWTSLTFRNPKAFFKKGKEKTGGEKRANGAQPPLVQRHEPHLHDRAARHI